MPKMRFTSRFTSRLDESTNQIWLCGWTGDVSDDVAKAARACNAAEFFGERAREAEEAYQMALQAEAEAAEADKKGAKTRSPPPALRLV